MTPLGASLAFIIISILISVIKHLVFPSNSPTSNEQSHIQLTKLYTITDKRPPQQSKSYSSFYQAYHQFHLSEVEEQKHRIEEGFMKQYNSVVMKKSVINDQFVVVCQENFLVTVQEGMKCQQREKSQSETGGELKKSCDWETQFNVFSLPLLKEETKQSILLKGRIGTTSKDTRKQHLTQTLTCNKVPNTKKYLLSFPLSSFNRQSNQQEWTLNKLFITKNNLIQTQSQSDGQDRNAKSNKSEKPSTNKTASKSNNSNNKKLQAKRYDIPSIKEAMSKKTSSTHQPSQPQQQKTFSLSHEAFPLQHPNHIPSIFYSTHQSTCYSTQAQPWLIRYKLADHKSWRQINFLTKQISGKLFQDLAFSSRIPPFDRKEKVEIVKLFLFQKEERVYCQQMEEEKRHGESEKNDCSQNPKVERNQYLTVVYLHANNEYRVEKFYCQLTFNLGNLSSPPLQAYLQQSTPENSPISMLSSYSLLLSQINPTRQIHSDCSIHPSKQTITQRHFDKFYWLYQNRLIYSMETSSLLCIFRSEIDQFLRVVEIQDLVHSVEVNKYSEFAFLDWKSLKKIINYKESYEQETLDRNVQQSLLNHGHNEFGVKNNNNNNTSNKSQVIKNSTQLEKTQTKSTQKSDIQSYIDVLREEFQLFSEQPKKPQPKGEQPNKNSKNKARKDEKKKSKKKSTTKGKSNKNTSKQSTKKKKKPKNSLNLSQMTPLTGPHHPTLQSSYNYSAIKNTPYPHRSLVKKYKFPLPFLLEFTKNMHIVDGDPEKPMILFGGVRQFLFTYKHNNGKSENGSASVRLVDYRYLTLGSTYQYTSKLFSQPEGTPQHEIQTSKSVIKDIISHKSSFSTSSQKPKDKLSIQIKDQTHPQVQNVLKSMYQSDQEILNHVKAIKSVSVEMVKKRGSTTSDRDGLQPKETYQRYLIVVWGWGIDVYMVDWDKDGLLRDDVTQEEIEQQLAKKHSSLIEYFLPFIELFATFYCMFQALISSR